MQCLNFYCFILIMMSFSYIDFSIQLASAAVEACERSHRQPQQRLQVARPVAGCRRSYRLLFPCIRSGIRRIYVCGYVLFSYSPFVKDSVKLLFFWLVIKLKCFLHPNHWILTLMNSCWFQKLYGLILGI